MKRFLLILSASLMLIFAACSEEENMVPLGYRTIVYSIVERPSGTAHHGNETDTVRLTNDDEWDALLNRLLDCTEEGSIIAFYNVSRTVGETKTKTSSSGSQPRTITTTSRNEIKTWSREMERLGLTVVVEYNRNTGTWRGTAYAVVPPSAHNEAYQGVLTTVGAHNMTGGVPLPGLEWALRVSADSVLTLVRGGRFITCNSDTVMLDGTAYHIGDSVTLGGDVRWAYEYDYTSFMVLVLDGSSVPHDSWSPLPVYQGSVMIGVPSSSHPYTTYYTYTLTMTLDEQNQTMYCTSTLPSQDWQGRIGGGIFHYQLTGQTDSWGNPILRVWNEDEPTTGADNAQGGLFSLAHDSDGSITLRDLNDYPNDSIIHTLGEIRLEHVYSGSWETWACDTTGFNIVMHLNTDGCVQRSYGYSSMPFYVNCTTPFQTGEFILSGGFYEGETSHLSYYSDETSHIRFTADYPDVRERILQLTPLGQNGGCLQSYTFYLK